MNRGGWILLLGSAALAAAVAAMATRERARSPEEDLRRIGDLMRKGRIDREEALSDLDRLAGRTADVGDSGLSSRIRLARGRVLMDIDALDRAQEDFEAVLDLGVLAPKETREVEDLLVDLDIRARRFAKGLDRVKDLIDRDPSDARAWARKGEMHRGIGERSLERGREIISSRLLAQSSALAVELFDRLAAMDPADPRRPAVGNELTAIFDPGDVKNLQMVLRAADQAARDNEQARVAFATSLSDLAVAPGRSSALAGLLDLLDLGGRGEEAAEIGICALRTAQEAGDTEAVARLVKVLDGLGRRGFASDLGQWLVAREGPIAPARLLDLCDLFYRSERWKELDQAGQRLLQIGNPDEVSAAALYLGLGQVQRGDWGGGRFTLQNWVASDSAEPFSGARVEAWRRIGEAAGHLRLQDDEIEALETAVQIDPENAGPSLLRLATLHLAAPHGGFRRPEEMWARAMSLMPKRTEELAPRWKRIGDQELKSEGFPRTGILRDPSWRRILRTPDNASPYQIYVLADELLRAGRAENAEPLSRRLVQSLPGFVPGLDLAIRVQQRLGRTNEVLGLLLARMRAAGADTKTRTILSRLPLGPLSPAVREQLMRADPEGFGRREFAREFLERDRADLALELVGDAQGPNALLEARVVAARACLDLDRPERAFELLDPLGRHVSSDAEAFRLFARAAAATGHRTELFRATTRAAAGLFPRRAEWLSLCDILLGLGESQSAMPLIQRLDSGRRTRGGEVLLRRAWAEFLLGNAQALGKTLERAAAFDTRGSVELVAVLGCSLDPDWSRLDDAIATLRNTSWRPTRLQEAAILALQGKREAARAVIDAARAGEVVDPLWVFADAFLAAEEGASPQPAPLSFGGDVEAELARIVDLKRSRDRHLPWCALLALDSPPAEAWVRRVFDDENPGESTAAPSLLSEWIAIRLARGERTFERRLLEGFLWRWPGFTPAWDRLEEVLRGLGSSPEDLEFLRERRLHVLGLRAGTRWEIDLEIARLQRRNGDLDAALESARRARAAEPSSAEVRSEIGRIRAARGEWKEAVASSLVASRMDAPGSDARTSGDLIAAIAGAGRANPPALPAISRQDELEALAVRAPHDPRVPVALGWLDLETDPRNPTIAVAQVYARLEIFLERHKDVALEKLCAGADEVWTDLLISIDLSRARDFLERERLRDPADLEPWVQIGRVGVAWTRGDPGMEELDLVRRMAPIPRVLRAHAQAHLARAPTLAQIEALMRGIRRTERRAELDPEISLRIARALFDLGPRGRQAAQSLATRLAKIPDVDSKLLAQAELLRAELWISYGTRAEAERGLAKLEEIGSFDPDPYRSTVFLSCTSLATGRARSPE